jgi:hypothetical protein
MSGPEKVVNIATCLLLMWVMGMISENELDEAGAILKLACLGKA